MDTAPATNSDSESQLKAANEEVYKHSLELAVKNKTLSLLRKLYEISVLALLPKELAEKLMQAIQEILSFERVSILLYEATSDILVPLAHAETARFKAIPRDENPLSKHALEHASQTPFFGPLITTKAAQYTEDLTAVWGSSLTNEALIALEKEGHIRSIIALPLIIDDKVRGIFTVHFNRIYGELSDYEKESIQILGNVITVALEKAIIYQELRETNERQETLIHFIGHEVKGFLTKNEAAFAALNDGDFGVLPETLKPFVGQALAQTRDGVGSVTDILKAANQKKGTIEYKKEPFDLRALVEEIVEKEKPLAERNGLAISFSADESGAPYTVLGDKGEFGDQVLKNLIDNAINYTPSGSIAVSLKKDPSTSFDKAQDKPLWVKKIIFAVKDTGVGITNEDKKNLFTEGGHGKDSQKTNVHSTGYGLYIAKNITVAHGGTIRAESEGAGKGSTFIVELPLHSAV
ncbi:MAG: HAMP domain-containing sensor histidine kinase [bacterium]|nr:HAMP domain-containing sensor histidine kinase [bacterium]